jgi:translocation and assembly module TamB
LYGGAIDGRIDNYRLDSVGIFTIDTDIDLESGQQGFSLAGKVRARSTRLLNASLQQYLGGNFVASSDVRYGGDGTIRFANLRLEAPDLRVTGGSGSYSPEGRIALTANGVSDRYGRIGVRLTGTLANPDARITATRPDLGIGLANLDARITGARGGYRFDLTGDTDYGPLSADVTLRTQGGTRIDITRANLSGVDFTGSLAQTRSGPFAGTLRANGNGLAGLVELAAAGRYQQADFHLRSTGTDFEGAAGLTIGSAIVDGRAILYDRPEVVAALQVADTRYGAFFIRAARAEVDYRGGRGRAKALLEGRSTVPFRVALNADLQPELWRVALNGRARGITFQTASPARITPRNGSYELLPTTITAGGGSIRLAGNYGRGIKLQSRMEGIDISLVNAFMPGSGLGGKASGSIDFEQASASAFPRADARLRLDDFTRTSAAVVSQPVDVNVVGKLLANGGEARAVIRRRGSVVGRIVATLNPLGPGAGSWTERLLAAPLGGGIRYNGPAEVLFSLAGQAGQTLSGPLGLAADFSCRVNDPCLRGIIRGKGLVYENQEYGTRLTNMTLAGRFDGNRLQVETLTATAGNGTVSASGTVGLAAAAGYPMDVAIKLDRARLARSEGIAATATGQLRLTKAAGQTALLSGQLRLPETRYQIVREGAAQVPSLTGVTFRPRRNVARITGDEPADPISSVFDLLRLDIDVDAPEELYVSGMGLESEWSARFTVRGTSTAPSMTGNVRLIRGTLGFAGRSFELTEGAVDFTGGPTIDPRLRIVASEDVEDILVRVNIDGRATDPEITFSSVPGLPQDEIMSRILFGSSIGNLSAIQAVQLAASLNSLRGSGGGLNPLGKLRSATGIDRLRILGADEKTGRGTALAAGQYITDDIYIELITDTRGFTATQLEVAITPWLSVLSQAGGSGASNVNVRIKKDY